MKKMVAALLLAVILTIGTVLPAAAAETAVGAWADNHKAGSYLTASEKKIFNKAVKDLVGVVYTPVLTLGKQVVSGTNYAFLCTAQTVTASPSYSWKVLIVNRSVKGKVKLVKVNSFSIKSVKTRKNVYKASTVPGAWSYSKEGTSSKGVPTPPVPRYPDGPVCHILPVRGGCVSEPGGRLRVGALRGRQPAQVPEVLIPELFLTRGRSY